MGNRPRLEMLGGAGDYLLLAAISSVAVAQHIAFCRHAAHFVIMAGFAFAADIVPQWNKSSMAAIADNIIYASAVGLPPHRVSGEYYTQRPLTLGLSRIWAGYRRLDDVPISPAPMRPPASHS